MAIGFGNEQKPVNEAIGRAHSKGILIFSAATNGRNVDPIYCPAILTDQVFGIFSTDAGIRESRSLNPSAQDQDSFAIFGEDVELPWEENGRRLLVRGTSYSTSIAAGLAALLLDFSRQEQKPDKSESDVPDLSTLKERRKMKRAFLYMADRDGSYCCLRPWKLLNDKFMSGTWSSREDVRGKQRKWIRGTVERLL